MNIVLLRMCGSESGISVYDAEPREAVREACKRTEKVCPVSSGNQPWQNLKQLPDADVNDETCNDQLDFELDEDDGEMIGCFDWPTSAALGDPQCRDCCSHQNGGCCFDSSDRMNTSFPYYLKCLMSMVEDC